MWWGTRNDQYIVHVRAREKLTHVDCHKMDDPSLHHRAIGVVRDDVVVGKPGDQHSFVAHRVWLNVKVGLHGLHSLDMSSSCCRPCDA